MRVCCKPIKGYNSFSAVFKAGQKLKTEQIFCSVVFNGNTEIDKIHTIYYGVSISKKIAKKAVVRNRVKRLLRESVRLLLKEFEARDLIFINSIILIWQIAPKHSSEISLDCVLPAVKNILEQASYLYKKKNKNKVLQNEVQL